MNKSIRERYPPPWDYEEIPAPGFKVVSSNKVTLAYVYYGIRGLPDQQLTRAEALAIVKAIVAMGNAGLKEGKE